MTVETRSCEEVDNLLGFAKINTNDLQPLSQTIHFAPNLNEIEYSVFELDENLVQTLAAGESLVVKGGVDDNAVVCTKTATYDLREAETSNSYLFTIGCQVLSKIASTESTSCRRHSNANVVSMCNTYFELKLCLPRLVLVKALLEISPYLGHIEEAAALEDEKLSETSRRYSLNELYQLVQASQLEIDDGIRRLRAISVDGYIRLLDPHYENQVLQSVLSLIDEMDWKFDAVPIKECCSTLNNLYPEPIIQQVLLYHTDVDPMENRDNLTNVSLSELKVCRHFGETLLRHTSRFHLEDFMRVWQEMVPSGLSVALSQLEGVAFVDRASQPSSVWYLRAIDLPADPQERFDALFRRKANWTLDEIRPYLLDLCFASAGPSAVTGLLNRFTRACTVKGQRVYSTRNVVN